MNETPDNLTPNPAAAAPGSGIDVAQYERDLAEARGQLAQYQQAISALQPYAEDIEWMAKDKANQEFIRNARKAYEDGLNRTEQLPPGMEKIAGDIADLKKFAQDFRTAQEQAQMQPRMKWLSEGKTFCEDLMRKHPDALGRSADPTLSWTGALQNICESRGLTWEEGWKILSPAFVKEKPSAPPPSMRADAGMPGLPPPSRPAPTGSPEGKKLGTIVLERMQSMS